VSQIFYNVMGPGPAVFFTVTAFFVMNFVCIPSVHAGSRTLWAFSRDEMVPLSRFWYRIDKRTDTPLFAVWLYVSLCILINLIGLGSPILIAAVFNICAIALNWSYCIPIACKLMYGKFERGPWHLGKFSVAINVWAVGWNCFLSIMFLLPALRPVTPENVSHLSPRFPPSFPPHHPPYPGQMYEAQFRAAWNLRLCAAAIQMNYAPAVLTFVIAFSVGHWFVRGRKHYIGPRSHAHIANGEAVIDEVPPDQEKNITTPPSTTSGNPRISDGPQLAEG